MAGNPDTVCTSGDRSYVTVVISGQRMHAAPPSCEYQRHSLRMMHGGKLSTAAGKIWTTLVASRQSSPSKCGHLCSAHVAASRNTSVGFKGAVIARISGVADTC